MFQSSDHWISFLFLQISIDFSQKFLQNFLKLLEIKNSEFLKVVGNSF